MFSRRLLILLSLLAPVTLGQCSDYNVSTGSLSPDADGKYMIKSEGLRAFFIPYGASIANLFINDTHGMERDIVLGYDNASYYTTDAGHPHLGGVPGRYANRIKNASFELDGMIYKVAPNDNKSPQYPQGVNQLHGGPDGWDWRNFTVVAHTENSITFSIVDPDGKEGFPGEVVSYITYTLTGMTWDLSMTAFATTKRTPIMLSSHTYWNLDGFQNNETDTALNHTLWMPYSSQRIAVDSILIPDGTILPNKEGSVNDFWSTPKQIGANLTSPDLIGNCGEGCVGYDNAYIVNREQHGLYNWRETLPVAQLRSAWSGIQVNIYSDQEAFQVYSCNGQNGSLPLKSTQGFHNDPTRPRATQKYGCIVMEVEDWIDGINHPEWERESKQVFGPSDGPYVLKASYVFSVDGTKIT